MEKLIFVIHVQFEHKWVTFYEQQLSDDIDKV